jgi:phosphinothricin acetyltransferase
VIRTVDTGDADAIARIYNHYIANTVVTFEETPVTESQMQERISESLSEKLPWLVALSQGEVIGYAYASKWKGRCAYRFAVEVTVYLDPAALGGGWGSQLYERLFSELKQRRYHVAMGGIALPNLASIALHEKFGMKKVAHFEQVGYKFDQWVDVGYWQLIFSD